MKKLLLVVLAALILTALVACGGETTTASTTTTTPTTTTEPVVTSTEPDGGNEDEYPKLTEEGYNIINGEEAYMAIDGFWGDTHAFNFENHHAALNYQWSLVLKFQECDESVYEQLIITDTDADGNEIVTINNQFKWILTIDSKTMEILPSAISVWNQTTYGYVRLGLGEDWTFPKGETTINEINLKFCDAATDEVVYWAWLTQPVMYGPYTFTPPKAVELDRDTSIDTDKVEQIPFGYLDGLSGPQGFNSEGFENCFDGEVKTKLCSEDPTVPIVFAISDDIADGFVIKSISIAGANDDENYADRIITKFSLYGANAEESDPAAWDLLLTVDNSANPQAASNYKEVNYALTKDSQYRYYKLVLNLDAGTKFQFSEVLLYTEKGTLTVN